MNDRKRLANAAKLLATTLGNFSAISFGVGVFEKDATGIVAGVYSRIFALIIAWGVGR
ncbi:MAG: hypothetical protein K6F46_05665 [Desulfovibrio sp.]|nr:hypothetical protein [Desulfovibrio sp.]